MIRLSKLFVGVLILALVVSLAVSALAADIKGKVVAVRLDQNELVITETFKNMTFQVNNDTRIFLNDRAGKLADLRPGDEAAVTYDRVGRKLIAVVVYCGRRQMANP